MASGHSAHLQNILHEVSQVLVGQHDMLQSILMGFLTGGHVLLEGAPGLAKTLAISTMARVTQLSFQRIQFTPDLMPMDLIGTQIFNPKTGEFSTKKGPIFSNIILADEINRAPAKVQSALLEAMAEKQVTIGEHSYALERPFLVLATQNSIEQEGTYPLPEAQLDRFMFKVLVPYPDAKQELQILNKMATDNTPQVRPVWSREDLMQARHTADQVHLSDEIKHYIVNLVSATRTPTEYGLNQIKNLIQLGVSPRATISLTRASKARAFIQGRQFVTADDIKAVCYAVMRHRILLSYEAEAESMSTDDVIKEVLNHVDVPQA